MQQSDVTGEPVRHRIAVIAGDGIGKEVVPEAQKAVEAAKVPVEWIELPWSADFYAQTGAMMPDDWVQILGSVDAVLLGACGWPTIPDHVSLWGLTLPLRQRLDLWVNVRPARQLRGIPSPLRHCPPGEVDMLFLRENTEGEYAGVGGRSHQGQPLEVAVETGIFTRAGIERLVRYGFQCATERSGRLTSATKSNANRFGFVLWDEIVEEVSDEFPSVQVERMLIDALAARIVLDPTSLDVVVASNLFGDILTDLAAAITGGLGLAPSANLAPQRPGPGVFESVHGSAPQIAGQGIANPIATIWSASLMLEHLRETDAARAVLEAIEEVCAEGPRTRDVGGDASTAQVGEAVAQAVAQRAEAR